MSISQSITGRNVLPFTLELASEVIAAGEFNRIVHTNGEVARFATLHEGAIVVTFKGATFPNVYMSFTFDYLRIALPVKKPITCYTPVYSDGFGNNYETEAMAHARRLQKCTNILKTTVFFDGTAPKAEILPV